MARARSRLQRFQKTAAGKQAILLILRSEPTSLLVSRLQCANLKIAESHLVPMVLQGNSSRKLASHAGYPLEFGLSNLAQQFRTVQFTFQHALSVQPVLDVMAVDDD